MRPKTFRLLILILISLSIYSCAPQIKDSSGKVLKNAPEIRDFLAQKFPAGAGIDDVRAYLKKEGWAADEPMVLFSSNQIIKSHLSDKAPENLGCLFFFFPISSEAKDMEFDFTDKKLTDISVTDINGIVHSTKK